MYQQNPSKRRGILGKTQPAIKRCLNPGNEALLAMKMDGADENGWISLTSTLGPGLGVGVEQMEIYFKVLVTVCSPGASS